MGTPAALAAARAARIRAAASSMVRTGCCGSGVPSSRLTPAGPGANDLGDAARHLFRRLPIAGFDVGSERHAYRLGNPPRRRDYLRPRRVLAILIAERPGEPAAGRRHRRKPAASKMRALIGSQALGRSRSVARGAACGNLRQLPLFGCVHSASLDVALSVADACYAISARQSRIMQAANGRGKGRDGYDACSFVVARAGRDAGDCCCFCLVPPRARRWAEIQGRSVLAEAAANNWIIGQVGGMTIDANDNIWVFQRPRSLTPDEKGAALKPPRSKCCVPAPSVLVFNPAGDVVKASGGPGDNQGYDWPARSTRSSSMAKASSGCRATARTTAWC